MSISNGELQCRHHRQVILNQCREPGIAVRTGEMPHQVHIHPPCIIAPPLARSAARLHITRLEGKVTGPSINREMVQAGADMCVALHRSIKASERTKDGVRQALAARILVYLIEAEQAIPGRMQASDSRLV
jgi:hypothetical protein